MSRLRVNAFTVSIDGYGAGPEQSLDHPLGRGGGLLHQWFVPTATFQREVLNQPGGTTGPDDDLARRSFENVGAWIMGRHMFTPSRGVWLDDGWQGWWGDEPPYHVPVFVLTHHARQPLELRGGTTFHFVTDGIHAALARARECAGDRDVRIGGGADTIRQYLKAGLIDELHLAVSPIVLGQGASLFDGIDMPALGYAVTSHEATAAAMHLFITRSDSDGAA